MATTLPTRDDRSRWARTPLIVKILGWIILIILLAWLVLFVTKGRFLKNTFVHYASKFMERPVTVGGDFNLYLNPLNVQFLAEDMTIANPTWTKGGQLFKAHRVEARLSTWKLLFGKRVFKYLNLDQGDIALQTDGKGLNNWSFNSTEPLVLPEIQRAAATGTVLSYVDPVAQVDLHLKFGDVTGDVRDKGQTINGPITMTGGGTARKIPFTLSGQLATPNETLAGGRNKFELHVAAAETKIDVSGTLPGATQFEGADLRIAVQGHNLATPFRLLGMAVPESRPYRLASNLTKTGNTWKFTHLTGKLGASDVAGSMTMSRPDKRIKLVADLSSQNLDILDVGPWIGYSPDRLQAQGGKGAVTQEGGRPRILPDAPLDIEGLKGYDADVKYKAANIRTGTIPIKNLELGLGLDNLLLTLKPIAFDIAGGRLTADVSINARKAPVVTDFDIRLSPVSLAKLFAGFELEESGTTGTIKGRIQLKGYGDTVRKSLGTSTGRIAVILPKGTFWIRNTELIELDIFQYVGKLLEKKLKEPSEVRCGLMGFTVKNGVAIADPVIIDTHRNVITGKGSFSFSDESLNLSIRANSKKFSLFSGQSPIGIGGWFAAPKINPISGQLLTRGGVGLAAGAVVSPIAAILAFVDTGNQKDTDCGPILEGARTPAVAAANEAAAHPGKDKDDLAKDKAEARQDAQKDLAKAKDDAAKKHQEVKEQTTGAGAAKTAADTQKREDKHAEKAEKKQEKADKKAEEKAEKAKAEKAKAKPKPKSDDDSDATKKLNEQALKRAKG